PAFKLIGPGLDRVAPKADRIDPETRDPAIVVVKHEWRLAPSLLPEPILHDAAQFVVPVAKHVGPHFEQITDNPFDRITPAVELGIDFLDLYPVLGLPLRMLQDWMLGPGRSCPPNFHTQRRYFHGGPF